MKYDEMNNIITFMQTKNIDTFQKLRILLFLHQHPEWSGTDQMYAKRFQLGDMTLVERVIIELQQAGLLECIEDRFKLSNDPDIRPHLEGLAKAYEKPFTRSQLIAQFSPGISKSS
jgi:hypothetical protein